FPEHEVGPAVAVDVAYGRGRRPDAAVARREAPGRPKRAVAVAQQHADGAAGEVCRYQVGPAVAVEVMDRDRARLRADGEANPGPERAVAVAHKQAARVAPAVRRHQVKRAVAVEVADRYGGRPLADADDQVVALERAVAVAPQHFHEVVRRVRDGEIE